MGSTDSNCCGSHGYVTERRSNTGRRRRKQQNMDAAYLNRSNSFYSDHHPQGHSVTYNIIIESNVGSFGNGLTLNFNGLANTHNCNSPVRINGDNLQQNHYVHVQDHDHNRGHVSDDEISVLSGAPTVDLLDDMEVLKFSNNDSNNSAQNKGKLLKHKEAENWKKKKDEPKI
eukprot:210916_1